MTTAMLKSAAIEAARDCLRGVPHPCHSCGKPLKMRHKPTFPSSWVTVECATCDQKADVDVRGEAQEKADREWTDLEKATMAAQVRQLGTARCPLDQGKLSVIHSHERGPT